MTVVQSDFVSVRERAAALGQPLPEGLVFLPENFEKSERGDEMQFRGEATTVTKILRQAGLPVARLGPDDQIAFIHNRSHDWALPVIFIGAELMKQSPDMVGMVIDLIRDYVIGQFRGTSDKKIKTEIVIEDRARKTYRKFTYEGDPAGLDELGRLIKRLKR